MWLTGERRGVGDRYSQVVNATIAQIWKRTAAAFNSPAMAADLRKTKSTFANQTGHFCE